jgi:hypothetical protein
MKLTTLMAAVAAILVFAQSANAREHYHRHYDYRHYVRSAPRYFDLAPATSAAWGAWPPASAPATSSAWGEWSATSSKATYRHRTVRAGLGGRPRAWCGWEMRQLVGSDPGPAYNLARNWAHWGHAGPPGVGAVVVWAHHVGKIVGQENGKWIIQSGNDGNRVRTRPLSIAHAIAFRWS